MKKISFLTTLMIWSVLLTWCNFSGSCDCHTADKNFCLDNWWTYSIVTSSDEEYWECMFPSGIGCRDDALKSWECNFNPSLDDIDTEEERLNWCIDNAQSWVKDFVEWAESVYINWWDESEWWASFVRSWTVSYTKNNSNYRIEAECVADFVDWSLNVSFWEEELVSGSGSVDWDSTSGDEEVLANIKIEDWETDEQIQANALEACSNAWWYWANWVCEDEDWTIIVL